MLKVKIIDENHEKDLERSVNAFLISGTYDIIDIQFRTAVSIFGDEQMLQSIIMTAIFIVFIYGGYFIITYSQSISAASRMLVSSSSFSIG